MTKRKDPYTAGAPVSQADANVSCHSKRRYKSRNEARDSAKKAKGRTGADLRPYRCLLCNGYHLTHWTAVQSAAVRRTIRARGTA